MSLLSVILAGILLSLLAASPAGAARTEYFGISQGREMDSQDLQGMAASRVRTNRFMIQWRRVQPTQGPPFNWAPTDRIMGSLAWHGIQAVPFVWGCPSWACQGPSRPPIHTAFAQTAWRNFLRAIVARYGRGGTYWANGYKQQYGASAVPMPVQAWQVWNEPNLKKYFDPNTTGQGVQKYAQLVKLSHDAIKSKDAQAKIVLGGMLGNGQPLAKDFLRGLYKVPGFKNNFDVAGLHPYTGYLDGFRRQILEFRGVMTNHGDSATPLWLTEFGWGSRPPDRFGINKGLAGQAQMLRDSFELLLAHRKAWNVQRLYWFLWRDPPPSPGGGGCSFCDSAGLLTNNRDPKPSYGAFRSYATEWVPPQASITVGPAQGSFTRDPTPTFSFRSNEPGSTFICRIGAGIFRPCSSPYTLPQLSDGARVFSVKAIDAPGNESQIVSRSFTVDTHAPAAPQITDSDPNSPANNNAPKLKGSAAAGSTVKLFRTAACSTVVAQGSAAAFASPGITASVPNNTTTAFRARATDAAGNTSACSGAFIYVEDSTP